MVDFGLSKILGKKDNQPKSSEKGFVGNPRFASLNCHTLSELDRSDDLESMIYVLIYFHTGYLPWMNI